MPAQAAKFTRAEAYPACAGKFRKAGRNAQVSGKVVSTMAATSAIMIGTLSASLTMP
jgi:hypothetical protein